MESSVRKRVLLSLLEKTEEGVKVKELKASLRITEESFTSILRKLENKSLITNIEGIIKQDLSQRLLTAIQAVELGVDLESVNRLLGWLEFEEMAAYIFEENGFDVLRRFRFRAENRRWEIDVLSSRRPYVICAECKHWTSGMGNSSARKIVEEHVEKTQVFVEHIEEFLERTPLRRWERALVMPMMLTLSPTPMKIYRRVPVVSVLALPRFLSGFEGQLERLLNIMVDLPALKPKGWQTTLR